MNAFFLTLLAVISSILSSIVLVMLMIFLGKSVSVLNELHTWLEKLNKTK